MWNEWDSETSYVAWIVSLEDAQVFFQRDYIFSLLDCRAFDSILVFVWLSLCVCQFIIWKLVEQILCLHEISTQWKIQ